MRAFSKSEKRSARASHLQLRYHAEGGRGAYRTMTTQRAVTIPVIGGWPVMATRKRPDGNEPPYGRLRDFAEDLGRVLGSAQNKAESWLGQRKTIAEQLAKVRDTADQLLRDLSGSAATWPWQSAVHGDRVAAGPQDLEGRPPRSAAGHSLLPSVRSRVSGCALIGRPGRRKLVRRSARRLRDTVEATSGNG
jgi:hypothetical protein